MAPRVRSIGNGFEGVDLNEPTAGANAEHDLVWSGDELLTITKTIGGIIYRKTITWTAGNPTNITPWIQIG